MTLSRRFRDRARAQHLAAASSALERRMLIKLGVFYFEFVRRGCILRNRPAGERVIEMRN